MYLMDSVYCYYRDSNTTHTLDHALLQAVSVVQGDLQKVSSRHGSRWTVCSRSGDWCEPVLAWQ